MVNTRKKSQTINDNLTLSNKTRKKSQTINNNLTLSDFKKKKCVVRIKKIKFENSNDKKEEVPQVKSDDIYEFSLQSSPEQEDPASDIVKKLIKQGKAVASRKKAIKSKSTKASKCPLFLKLAGTKSKRERPKRENKPAPVEIDVKTTKGQKNVLEDFGNLTNDTITARRSSIIDRNKLALEARKIIMQSTPVTKNPSAHQNFNISPISNKSPWRPTDDTLPRLLYISKNSDQLPSYSSDVLACLELDEMQKQPKRSVDLWNIENISPNKSSDKIVKQDFIPSFRAPQAARNPLSSIQILDIVKLPNYAPIIEKIAKKKSPRKNPLQLSLSKKNSRNHLPTAQQRINTTYNIRSPIPGNQNVSPIRNPQDFSIDNCFGFNESFSDDTENSNVCPNENSNVLPNEDTLQTKLKTLERLVPPKSARINFNKIPSIFPTETKQKDIRQMLSTTVAQNDEINTAETNITDHSGNSSLNITEDLHLFDDIKPQTSFNSSAGLKTYTRTPRKPKKRTKQFVLFPDVSESEEDEPEESPKRKKRKKREDKKTKQELYKFVEEFNSMCEEVDQYKLQIERAKDEEE